MDIYQHRLPLQRTRTALKRGLSLSVLWAAQSPTAAPAGTGLNRLSAGSRQPILMYA